MGFLSSNLQEDYVWEQKCLALKKKKYGLRSKVKEKRKVVEIVVIDSVRHDSICTRSSGDMDLSMTFLPSYVERQLPETISPVLSD